MSTSTDQLNGHKDKQTDSAASYGRPQLRQLGGLDKLRATYLFGGYDYHGWWDYYSNGS